MTPHFLNVDLEIVSRSRLDSLASEMGKRVSVLYSGPVRGRNFLAVESFRFYKRPDAAICALCKIIETLSPSARRTWNRASKVFDVGYELRTAERASRFVLRSDTLDRIVNLGAELAVTYYQEGNAQTAIKPRGQ